jgi:hypothetical protein
MYKGIGAFAAKLCVKAKKAKVRRAKARKRKGSIAKGSKAFSYKGQPELSV